MNLNFIKMDTGRDYSKTKSKGAVPQIACPIRSCNKKYTREEKLKKHIEKDHFFETRNSNNFRLGLDYKIEIAALLKKYIAELVTLANGGTVDAKNLSHIYPNTPPEEAAKLHYEFAVKVCSKTILEVCNWEIAFDDFAAFLRMGLPYYDTNFCPTLIIDIVWHATMTSPRLYEELCSKTVKSKVPHCHHPRTLEEDRLRHEYFLEVFRRKWWEPHCPPFQDSPVEEVNLDLICSNLDEEIERCKAIMKKHTEEKEKRERKMREDSERNQAERVRKRVAVTAFAKKHGIQLPEYYDGWANELDKLRAYGDPVSPHLLKQRMEYLQRNSTSSC